MTTTQRKMNPIEYFGPTETHEKALMALYFLASNAMSSPLSLSTYKYKNNSQNIIEDCIYFLVNKI